MTKIFIDGSAGTTGLRIRERLEARGDTVLLTLSEEERKNPASRKRMLNEAEVAFLCLPDDAAREAVRMVENPATVVLDTSTAHRTAPGWAYGFPELGQDFYDTIKESKRIAVPGCHAGGFLALVYPLIAAGILHKDAFLSCFSQTGYSGGGKKMIAAYEDASRDTLLAYPRLYGLTQTHKHLKEMQAIATLSSPPAFLPVVGDFYSGMQVSVPLSARELRGAGMADIKRVYQELYTGPVVRYCGQSDTEGFLSAGALAGQDNMAISVYGNEERILLTAVYDNLGKGASGAAIECLNIVAGHPLTEGLAIGNIGGNHA